MNLVVTGGAGFIGSYLVKYLVNQGHSVTVIDNLHTGKKENLDGFLNQIEFQDIDILDYENLRKAVKNIDGLFHHAALTKVQESYIKQKEYNDVNVKGTENILRLAKQFGFKVVHASSSSVYGNTEKIPIKEDHERKPLNPYGVTKLEDEYLIEKYVESGVRAAGLRYFNVYGKGQSGEYAGVIIKFIENIAKHKPPLIFGDGSQVRDFVFAEDVAKATSKVMESKANHAFINIGSGTALSILDLANIMIRVSGLNLKPVHTSPLGGDVRASQADITLAKKLLNWEPETKLEQGLRKIFPSMKDRK